MPDSNNVYIYGSEGYIGSALVKKLNELSISSYSVGRRNTNDVVIDLSEIDLNVLTTFKAGDRFIFLAAISSPELCAENYDYAYKINVTNTALIINYLLDQGVSVLFASSDTVYGRTDSPVDELDNVNPQFAYAEMKAEIEERFKERSNFKVMRLSYVWSMQDKFTIFLLESHAKNILVDVFDPFVRSIVTLRDVLEFIVKFIKLSEEIPGVVNLAGPEFVSRLQLVEWISKYLSIDFSVSKPGDDFFKYRPDQILMQTIYLDNILGHKTTNIEDEITQSFLTN